MPQWFFAQYFIVVNNIIQAVCLLLLLIDLVVCIIAVQTYKRIVIIQYTDIISTDYYALNIILSFVKIDVIVRFMITTNSIYGNSSARILMFYSWIWNQFYSVRVNEIGIKLIVQYYIYEI